MLRELPRLLVRPPPPSCAADSSSRSATLDTTDSAQCSACLNQPLSWLRRSPTAASWDERPRNRRSLPSAPSLVVVRSLSCSATRFAILSSTTRTSLRSASNCSNFSITLLLPGVPSPSRKGMMLSRTSEPLGDAGGESGGEGDKSREAIGDAGGEHGEPGSSTKTEGMTCDGVSFSFSFSDIPLDRTGAALYPSGLSIFFCTRIITWFR
mmetsp:Transcript_34483/g.78698  ORF Transcript_34483/g.78698 Transcript_34483/m.78698 type:complete len:210 (+) Transcript_34483:139-768(+)